MATVLSSLEEAARELAAENHYYEKNISKTYWFPDPDGHEVRLVHVDAASLENGDTVYKGF